MSTVTIHDLTERARARLGRSYQVAALAPFPARPAQHLWSFTRRGFVHGAGDLGAGFGFGGDSNLLRRLKMGLLEEGVDRATIDSLTERDVTSDARGVVPRASALAKLPAPIREAIAAGTLKPKPQNWFFEKRPAARIASTEGALRAAEYEDSGAADVEVLRVGVFAGGTNLNSAVIAPPVRITYIHASVLMAVSPNNFFEWSVTPPGVADNGFGDAVNGAVSVLDNGTSFNLACDVIVLHTPVILTARISQPGGLAPSTILLAVSYRRLRRKPLS